MGQALERIAVDKLPPGVTQRQYLLALAVVNGAKSWSAAMRQAGYAPTSIACAVGTISNSPGVQSALTAVRAKQRGNRDKARQIIETALDKSIDAIQSETDVARLLPAAKLAADVAANLDDDGPPQMTLSPHQWRALIRRAILRYARIKHGSTVALPGWLSAGLVDG